MPARFRSPKIKKNIIILSDEVREKMRGREGAWRRIRRVDKQEEGEEGVGVGGGED